MSEDTVPRDRRIVSQLCGEYERNVEIYKKLSGGVDIGLPDLVKSGGLTHQQWTNMVHDVAGRGSS